MIRAEVTKETYNYRPHYDLTHIEREDMSITERDIDDLRRYKKIYKGLNDIEEKKFFGAAIHNLEKKIYGKEVSNVVKRSKTKRQGYTNPNWVKVTPELRDNFKYLMDNIPNNSMIGEYVGFSSTYVNTFWERKNVDKSFYNAIKKMYYKLKDANGDWTQLFDVDKYASRVMCEVTPELLDKLDAIIEHCGNPNQANIKYRCVFDRKQNERVSMVVKRRIEEAYEELFDNGFANKRLT